jgi:hypothetical protein
MLYIVNAESAKRNVFSLGARVGSNQNVHKLQSVGVTPVNISTETTYGFLSFWGDWRLQVQVFGKLLFLFLEAIQRRDVPVCFSCCNVRERRHGQYM